MPSKLYIYDVMTDKANDPLAVCLKFVFLILSWCYGLMVRVWRYLYLSGIRKRYTLDKPVISVGNITVGGVGKTPLVEYLVRSLKAQGLKPAILIRGYMAKKFHYASPQNGLSDEALELKRYFPDVPVMVGPDRVQSARNVPKDYPVDVFILDDAYQHWKLKRDLDILAVDATNPFGNRHMIPRGIVREPLNGLRRAHVAVITKVDLGQDNVGYIKRELRKYHPDIVIAETVHAPQELIDIRSNGSHPLDLLKGKKVCCFSSIGNPDAFTQTLLKLDYQLGRHFVFVDHYQYGPDDFAQIVDYCHSHDVVHVVTTEKDAVKIEQFLDRFPKDLSILSLKINIHFTANENEFLTRTKVPCHS